MLVRALHGRFDNDRLVRIPQPSAPLADLSALRVHRLSIVLSPVLVPVPVTLTIEPGCSGGVSSVQVLFNIGIFFGTDDPVELEVTPVPPDGISISTSDLTKAESSDEETLWCKVTLVLEEGDPLPLKQVAHDMIGDAAVEPFVLSCVDGEFDLS